MVKMTTEVGRIKFDHNYHVLKRILRKRGTLKKKKNTKRTSTTSLLMLMVVPYTGRRRGEKQSTPMRKTKFHFCLKLII